MAEGRKARINRLIFITGTDTGAGKTVLTGLLLAYLRSGGERAWAMKPFCSGGRGDALLLNSLQENELELDEVNPFYFREAVAPLIAARRHNRTIPLPMVLEAIQGLRRKCEWLLVEGAGGLMAPLGEGYTCQELVSKTKGEVVVATRNRLGVINHAALTVESLQHVGISNVRLVIIDQKSVGLAARTNPSIVSEMLPGTSVFRLPWLGKRVSTSAGLKKNAKKFEKTLAEILGTGSF